MQNYEINNVNYDGHKRNGGKMQRHYPHGNSHADENHTRSDDLHRGCAHSFKCSPRKNYRCDRIYGDYDRNFWDYTCKNGDYTRKMRHLCRCGVRRVQRAPRA